MNRFLVCLLVFCIFVTATSSFFYYERFQKRKHDEMKLAVYSRSLIPHYKLKSRLIANILVDAKIEDPSIAAITLHAQKWEATSQQSIREIDELASYLDHRFSEHVLEIQSRALSAPTVMDEMSELRLVDEAIHHAKEQL